MFVSLTCRRIWIFNQLNNEGAGVCSWNKIELDHSKHIHNLIRKKQTIGEAIHFDLTRNGQKWRGVGEFGSEIVKRVGRFSFFCPSFYSLAIRSIPLFSFCHLSRVTALRFVLFHDYSLFIISAICWLLLLTESIEKMPTWIIQSFWTNTQVCSLKKALCIALHLFCNSDLHSCQLKTAI